MNLSMVEQVSSVIAAALVWLSIGLAATAARAAGVPPAIYDHQEQAEGMTKEVRLAIPAGLSTVRGILVFTNAAGGDTRDDYRQSWHEEFLYLHGFAFLGTKGCRLMFRTALAGMKTTLSLATLQVAWCHRPRK
jgi:hypothetical protein